MKRRFGGEVFSRKEELKYKEIELEILVYNLYREIQLEERNILVFILFAFFEILDISS